MTPRLENHVYQRILAAADAGDDPLSFGDFPPDRTVRCIDAVMAAMTGMDAQTAARVAASLATRREDGVSQIDRAMAELAASAGLDPLAMCWLAQVDRSPLNVYAAEVKVGTLCTVDIAAVGVGHCATSMLLTPTMVWDHLGQIYAWGLPATLLNGVAGQMLRDVVSHPVLDRYDIRITDVDEEGNAHVMSTDYQPKPIPIDELATIAPCGCR